MNIDLKTKKKIRAYLKKAMDLYVAAGLTEKEAAEHIASITRYDAMTNEELIAGFENI